MTQDEGTNEQDGGDQDNDSDDGPSENAKTFTQEQLNSLLADQKRKVESRYRDYDELKEAKRQLRALTSTADTAAERAAEKAREDALAEARATNAPRLVRAEFKAAAKGVLTKDQLDTLLEDVDLSKYVDEDGEADEARIARKIAAIAPPKEKEREFPDLGGGRRGGAPKNTSMNDFIRRAAGIS